MPDWKIAMNYTLYLYEFGSGLAFVSWTPPTTTWNSRISLYFRYTTRSSTLYRWTNLTTFWPTFAFAFLTVIQANNVVGVEILKTFTRTQTWVKLFSKTCCSVGLGPVLKRLNIALATIFQSLPTSFVHVFAHKTNTCRREQWITNLIFVHTVCVTFPRSSVTLTDCRVFFYDFFIDRRLLTCHILEKPVVMLFVSCLLYTSPSPRD